MELNSLSSLTNEQILAVIDVFQKCTSDYIFFWNLTTDVCYYSKSSVEQFNETTTQWTDYSKRYWQNVHPDDVRSFKKAIGSCLIGKSNTFKAQYRRKGIKDDFVWLEGTGQIVYTADKHKILAGRIAEIGKKQIADNKTGLKKRITFKREIDEILSTHPQSINYILRVDIDHFKKINEHDGLEYGDKIIKQLSKLIVKTIGSHATAYTLDADDFIIVDTDPEKTFNPVKIYNILRAEIVNLIRKDSHYTFYTISAAAMLDNFEEKNGNNILEMTEFTLAEAKRNGRNQIKFYDEEQFKNYVRRLDIEKRIRSDIVHGFENIHVFFQPIVDAENNKIIGAEALLRYTDEVYGSVPPVVLIPILEETNLIVPVGRFVFKTACQMCLKWRQIIPDFHININLSYIQIRRSNLMIDIDNIIEELQLPYNAITLEITESGYIESDSRIMELFQQLHCKNIKLALDDFGTGYSNMRYLDELKADTIKFDRNFTVQAVKNDFDYTVIQHMIVLIHSIGGKVCIEGIEEDEELKKMKTLKPDMIQGFLFGKPVSAVDFEKMLKEA